MEIKEENYPIVKKIRGLIADLQNFETSLSDIAIAILSGFSEWPINDEGEQLGYENFYIYEIQEEKMLISCGDDSQQPEMFWVFLEEDILKHKKIQWILNLKPVWHWGILTIEEVEKLFSPKKEELIPVENDPIKITRFEYKPAKLYTPNNKSLGLIYNAEELADVRIQIKNQNLEGYYLLWNDIKINILKSGKLDRNPNGFFDELTDRLLKLI